MDEIDPETLDAIELILDSVLSSNIPELIAKLIRNIVTALESEGFSREEAMGIIQALGKKL